MTVQKLKEITNGLDVEIKEFQEDCSNSVSCLKVLNCSLKDIIKTIIMFNENNDHFAFVLRGDQRIDRKPLKKELSCRDLRLATKEEIMGVTGFPLGGVPPLGFKSNWIIESDLIHEKNKTFLAGGGSKKSLMKITPEIILNITKAKIISFNSSLS